MNMRSINENEISRFKAWAVQKDGQGCFGNNALDCTDSFWIDRTDETTYIKEYQFATVPEFEALCADIIEQGFDEQIKKVVSVALIKNMPREEVKKTEMVEGEEKLPDYIYVF